MEKKSFVIYFDYRQHLELLTAEEQGLLFMALIDYGETGKEPELEGAARMAFSFIKAQIDRDTAKYEETRRKRIEAGRQGGKASKSKGVSEKQTEANQANASFGKQSEANQANASFGKQSEANQAVNVNDNVTVNVNDTVTDTNKNNNRAKAQKFIPPTVEEVEAYCLERQNNVDAQQFVNFYESKGWMVGKNKMKDWKAAVRTWEGSRQSAAVHPRPPNQNNTGRLDWIDDV